MNPPLVTTPSSTPSPLAPAPRRYDSAVLPVRRHADTVLTPERLAAVRAVGGLSDDIDAAVSCAVRALADVVGAPPFSVPVTVGDAASVIAVTTGDAADVAAAVATRTSAGRVSGPVHIAVGREPDHARPVECQVIAEPGGIRLRWWITSPVLPADTAERLAAAGAADAVRPTDVGDELRAGTHRMSPALLTDLLASTPGVSAVSVTTSGSGLVATVTVDESGPATADLVELVRTRLSPGHEPDVWDLRSGRSSAAPRSVLEAIWREELGASHVDDHATFFGLGGDSLSAMRVARRIHGELGVDLGLAAALQLFTTADFASFAEHVALLPAAAPGDDLPTVRPDPAARFAPFPLTDQQQAYAIGRSDQFSSGNIACHTYMEFDETAGAAEPLDADRFAHAWRRLVDRHDALRLTIDDESMTQRVLPATDRSTVGFEDLTGLSPQDEERALTGIRGRLSHRVAKLTEPPLYDVVVVRRADGRHRVCVGLDGLIADLAGTGTLFAELGRFYADPVGDLPALDLTFRDYVLAEARAADTAAPAYERSRRYWHDRLDSLPGPPDLPLRVAPEEIAEPRFEPRPSVIAGDVWRRVCANAAARGVTSSGVAAACYAQALAGWSASRRFTINVPCFNRLPLHPDVGRAVGEFASLILVEVDASRRETFGEFAARVQTQIWSDLDHPHVTGIEVLRELMRRRGGFGQATMPYVFTSTTALAGDPSRLLDGLLARGHRVAQTPQVWVDLILEQRDDELLVNWDSLAGLFPDGLMDDVVDAFHRQLHALADDDAWERPALDPRPPAQLAVRRETAGPEVPLPPRPAHLDFFERAEREPGAPAVIHRDRTVSYGELADRALRLAGLLRRRGVGPDVPVAVVAEPSIDRVAAVLGILAAGGAYVPVDPQAPAARIEAILGSVDAPLVVTDRDLSAQPWLADRPHLLLGTAEPFAGEPADGPHPAAHGDLAYVLFTSGSTGTPKGVMVEHGSVANFVAATVEIFGTGPGHRFLGVSALHHDMSVYDHLGVLGTGAALVLPPTTDRRDAQAWATAVRRYEITGWVSVPTMMEMTLEEAAPGDLRSLRTVVLGGDWIHPPMVGRLLDAAPGVHLRGIGGPTETTVWNIWHRVERRDAEGPTVPYGRAIRNTVYRVLDERLCDRPDLAVGEMYCTGASLARGYWRDPERTRQGFVVHPDTGERLYRTGDLGRFRPDGLIEFVGRADFQLKINGHRIEPGEVETAVRADPAVRTCVVTGIASGDRRGDRGLVAYVTATPGYRLDTAALLAGVRERCPAHMVPTIVIELDALPLNANGKIDRAALPTPVSAAPDDAAQACGPLETALAAMWSRQLDAPVGRLDDFFRLGGDSLVAARLAARIRAELPFVDVTLQDLFNHPTVAAVARLAAERAADPAVIDEVATIWLDVEGLDDAAVARALDGEG